jgi:transposase
MHMPRLSDAHWKRIREHVPEENVPDDRPGRKPVPAREVLDAVLWTLHTGAQWSMLPQCYPNYKNFLGFVQLAAMTVLLRQVQF